MSLPRLRARLLSGDELSTNDAAALLAALDLYEAANAIQCPQVHGDLLDAIDAFEDALAGLTDSEGEGQ